MLPLWSKIGNSIQELSKKSPFTSASCENYFSYLKQNEFMTPMRADEAVTTHLASINGTLKIESTSTLFKENDKVSCEKRQKVAEKEETKNKNKEFQLLDQEVWKKRGKGKNYFLLCKEVKNYFNTFGKKWNYVHTNCD